MGLLDSALGFVEKVSPLGGIASAALGAFGQSNANSANKHEARKNREFQERMSSTAHQREVADLRAAGLNPILSATGGPGASTPSGSLARMENTAKNVASDISKTAQIKAQLQQVRAQTGLSTEQTKVQAEQIHYIREMTKGAANSARATELANSQTEHMEAFFRENPWARILQQMLPTGAIAAGALGVGTTMGRKPKPFNPLNHTNSKIKVGKKGKN